MKFSTNTITYLPWSTKNIAPQLHFSRWSAQCTISCQPLDPINHKPTLYIEGHRLIVICAPPVVRSWKTNNVRPQSSPNCLQERKVDNKMNTWPFSLRQTHLQLLLWYKKRMESFSRFKRCVIGAREKGPTTALCAWKSESALTIEWLGIEVLIWKRPSVMEWWKSKKKVSELTGRIELPSFSLRMKCSANWAKQAFVSRLNDRPKQDSLVPGLSIVAYCNISRLWHSCCVCWASKANGCPLYSPSR